MLVLSRKVGQRLVIGGGITVVVKRIAGQRVTLGIEAPSDTKIKRGELPTFELEDEPAEPDQLPPTPPVNRLQMLLAARAR